jgi:hypothetical protein
MLYTKTLFGSSKEAFQASSVFSQSRDLLRATRDFFVQYVLARGSSPHGIVVKKQEALQMKHLT